MNGSSLRERRPTVLLQSGQCGFSATARVMHFLQKVCWQSSVTGPLSGSRQMAQESSERKLSYAQRTLVELVAAIPGGSGCKVVCRLYKSRNSYK